MEEPWKRHQAWTRCTVNGAVVVLRHPHATPEQLALLTRIERRATVEHGNITRSRLGNVGGADGGGARLRQNQLDHPGRERRQRRHDER
jgi:hypothetical protein